MLLVRLAAVAVVVLVALRVAWISDDALITLRTALNITHGWGPGYNATEAVQGYTHPLWFLLWVWIGSWTNQWILGLFVVSAALVGVTVALMVWRTSSIARIVVVTAFLLLSNAFIDYTTSGLENPLSYGLVAVAITMSLGLVRQPRAPVMIYVLLGLTGAAILLTRLDLALLIAIPGLLMLWNVRTDGRRVLAVMTALVVPLAGWFMWSFFTYSALLANTFEAKTNVQIPQSELVIQGFRYLWVSLEKDPVTLLGLVLGLGLGLFAGPAILRAWSLGATVYIGYVVWVGGDFMAGRFLSVPFVVAMFIVAASPAHLSRTSKTQEFALPAAVGVAVLLLGISFLGGTASTALANPSAPRWEVDQNLNANVADERGVYVLNVRDLGSYVDSLSRPLDTAPFVPIGDGTDLNRPLRQLDYNAKNWPNGPENFDVPVEVGVFCGFLGTVGIVTGPATHLIDECALTDRYLARRPYISQGPYSWKMGHFVRDVPPGYVEAIAKNDASQMKDPAEAFFLSELWRSIR